MVNRLVDRGQIENNRIELVDLKDKLQGILEVNEEAESCIDGEPTGTYQQQPITQAQLAAYEKLLGRLGKDQKGYDHKTSPCSDTASELLTLASTASKKGQTFYSVRKIKDYLQKKAKQAKITDLNVQKVVEQEAVKKIMEEYVKPRNEKLKNSFSPMLSIIASPEEGNITFIT
jgi:hypothetical protein